MSLIRPASTASPLARREPRAGRLSASGAPTASRGTLPSTSHS